MSKICVARPGIQTITSGAELRKWYWLKRELQEEARRVGVKGTGAKFTILERLCHFRDSGEIKWPGDTIKRTSSKFDWHSGKLTAKTPITDNYKNTQNVRRFFQTYADPKFKFNIALIDWIRSNPGKTLGDAAKFWRQQRDSNASTAIKPHNQYNQYFRDFMEDNPSLGIKDARAAWARKKQLPSETGRHQYARSDLDFLKSD